MAEHDDDGGGDSLTDRIMARSGPGLYRRTMPDGGEVVTGPVAQRVACASRALTMDHTIFVDDNFDIRSPKMRRSMRTSGITRWSRVAMMMGTAAMTRRRSRRARSSGWSCTAQRRATTSRTSVDAGEVADP